MAEKPKKSGKSNGVLYVFCDHLRSVKVRQGVFYKLNDHGLNKSLELTYRQSCFLCEGINQEAPTVSTTNNLQDMPVLILGETSQFSGAEFVDAVQQVDNSLVLFVEELKQKCLKQSDPLSLLNSNAAQFGIEANRSVVNAILGFGGNLNILI